MTKAGATNLRILFLISDLFPREATLGDYGGGEGFERIGFQSQPSIICREQRDKLVRGFIASKGRAGLPGGFEGRSLIILFGIFCCGFVAQV